MSPHAQSSLAAFRSQLLIPHFPNCSISSSESVIHIGTRVNYKLTCFILFISLFFKTEASHYIVAPTPLASKARSLPQLPLFPSPHSPTPISYLNVGLLAVWAPGENLLLGKTRTISSSFCRYLGSNNIDSLPAGLFSNANRLFLL